LKTQLFGFHHDLPPAAAAHILGGHVVFSEQREGQWVAVIELDRVEEASVRLGLLNLPDRAKDVP
jgi:hypothetical protein